VCPIRCASGIRSGFSWSEFPDCALTDKELKTHNNSSADMGINNEIPDLINRSKNFVVTFFSIFNLIPGYVLNINFSDELFKT
jgi:hypothetical protein